GGGERRRGHFDSIHVQPNRIRGRADANIIKLAAYPRNSRSNALLRAPTAHRALAEISNGVAASLAGWPLREDCYQPNRRFARSTTPPGRNKGRDSISSESLGQLSPLQSVWCAARCGRR